MAGRKGQTTNLWPTFDLKDQPRGIRRILLDAGSGIAERTGDQISFDVDTRPDGMGGFVHNCYLVAEKINFRYPFIKVSHTLEPYPVIVEADDFPQGTPVGDENELINKLMLIFTSGQTRKIVGQILDALS